jgi:hypothetical protein
MGAIRNIPNLRNLVESSGSTVFIETGAGYGTGIFTVLPFALNNILSVEIDPNQTNLLNAFFRFDSRVKVFNATSKQFLEKIIPQLGDNIKAFFFLDAHFPLADFGIKDFDEEKDEDLRMPLWDELNVIRSFQRNNDTILIDDISLYDDSDRAYEDDHKKKPIAHKLLPKKHRNYLINIIELFRGTHSAEVLTQEQGYLLLKPKAANYSIRPF